MARGVWIHILVVSGMTDSWLSIMRVWRAQERTRENSTESLCQAGRSAILPVKFIFSCGSCHPLLSCATAFGASAFSSS